MDGIADVIASSAASYLEQRASQTLNINFISTKNIREIFCVSCIKTSIKPESIAEIYSGGSFKIFSGEFEMTSQGSCFPNVQLVCTWVQPSRRLEVGYEKVNPGFCYSSAIAEFQSIF